MRLAAMLVLILMAALGPTVLGRAQAAATDAAPAQQTTTVTGTAPDLEGRWLVLAHVNLAQGSGRTVPSAWEVTRPGGQLELREWQIALPPAQQKALDAANEKGATMWAPTAADVAAIRAIVNDPAPDQRGITEVKHEIFARDGFGADIQKEEMAKDAIWVIREFFQFAPGGGRPIKQVTIYAALAKDAADYTGNYLNVAIAAAPFPIPITFKGTFRLVPLGQPTGGFWARVGDFFAGCNRR